MCFGCEPDCSNCKYSEEYRVEGKWWNKQIFHKKWVEEMCPDCWAETDGPRPHWLVSWLQEHIDNKEEVVRVVPLTDWESYCDHPHCIILPKITCVSGDKIQINNVTLVIT